MIRIFLICAVFLFALVSCNLNNGVNKFSDETHVKIANLQDHRYSDSLFQFFGHINPKYRRDAVLAFASIQDTMAIERLGKILNEDLDDDVRAAAAFALGQTGTEKSFSALAEAIVSEKESSVL